MGMHFMVDFIKILSVDTLYKWVEILIHTSFSVERQKSRGDKQEVTYVDVLHCIIQFNFDPDLRCNINVNLPRFEVKETFHITKL